MITSFILSIVYSFFSFLISFLPAGTTLPTGFSSSLSYITYAANTLNYIIPISALFVTLTVVLAVELAIWTFQGLMWVYRHIPFIGH